MENNSAKKLSRAAAILSLTAVLASMPVSASTYAAATSSGAEARATGRAPGVYVEVSCEYGSTSRSSSSDKSLASVETSISVSDADYHDGDVRGTFASAWAEGEEVATAYWPG